jgi:hypothetical protein
VFDSLDESPRSELRVGVNAQVIRQPDRCRHTSAY